MEARHAIFLATILGDAATITTTFVIIGMDFVLNIYHALQIVYFIKKKKANPSDDSSKFRIIRGHSTTTWTKLILPNYDHLFPSS